MRYIFAIITTCVTPSLGFLSTAASNTRVNGDLSSSDSLIDESIFLNEEDALSNLNFPLSEAKLITSAKEFLSANQGVDRPDLLASDFSFMGPVVGGPSGLKREAYLEAVGNFKIKEAFPDFNPRFHDFRADKLDAGRVWFTTVASGTDDGGFLGNKPTGKSFMTPPQACSLKFNEEGKAIKYTIGHVVSTFSCPYHNAHLFLCIIFSYQNSFCISGNFLLIFFVFFF